MKNGCKLSRTTLLSTAQCVGIALLFLLDPLAAQSLRDPTLPPTQIEPASPATREQKLSSERGPLTIVVRDGRRYVVLGTRLYAQGQLFGKTRIERISETEVWFLENGVLQKIPRYSGVERRIAAPVPASSGRVASTPKPS